VSQTGSWNAGRLDVCLPPEGLVGRLGSCGGRYRLREVAPLRRSRAASALWPAYAPLGLEATRRKHKAPSTPPVEASSVRLTAAARTAALKGGAAVESPGRADLQPPGLFPSRSSGAVASPGRVDLCHGQCLLRAEGDTRALRRPSGFDPLRTSRVQCNPLSGCRRGSVPPTD
jgi:hypothetical protein